MHTTMSKYRGRNCRLTDDANPTLHHEYVERRMWVLEPRKRLCYLSEVSLAHTAAMGCTMNASDVKVVHERAWRCAMWKLVPQGVNDILVSGGWIALEEDTK